MRLAFYAPMKSPNHPVPSGDRTIARSLVQALKHAGASVALCSDFYSRDGRGDPDLQQKLIANSAAEIARLIAVGRLDLWQAWITYHNYYKAPDLIGPSVSSALGIPYLQVESTRARKRLDGPWAAFAKAAEDAADAADFIFYFTERDAEALRRDAPSRQKLGHLLPFICYEPQIRTSPLRGPILAVGMMRARDKLLSYEIIANTLAMMPNHDWSLEIAGSGPARAEVEAIMAPLKGEVKFLGALGPKDLQTAYHTASVFFWPGVNEALGMVYLEAQAAGLPILAQNRPGVRDVLPPGYYPEPEAGSSALSILLNDLLIDPRRRETLGKAAYDNVTKNHLLPAASATLKAGLAAVGLSGSP